MTPDGKLSLKSSNLDLYPNGDKLPDQIQIAIDVANKVSRKTQSI